MNILVGVGSVLFVVLSGYAASLNAKTSELANLQIPAQSHSLDKRSNPGEASICTEGNCFNSQEDLSELESNAGDGTADRRLAIALNESTETLLESEHDEPIIGGSGETHEASSNERCSAAASFLEALLHNDELKKTLGAEESQEDNTSNPDIPHVADLATIEELAYSSESSNEQNYNSEEKSVEDNFLKSKYKAALVALEDLFKTSNGEDNKSGPTIYIKAKKETTKKHHTKDGKVKVTTKEHKSKRVHTIIDNDSTPKLEPTELVILTPTTSSPLTVNAHVSVVVDERNSTSAAVPTTLPNNYGPHTIDELSYEGEKTQTPNVAVNVDLLVNKKNETTPTTKNVTEMCSYCKNQLPHIYPYLQLKLVNGNPGNPSELLQPLPYVLPVPLGSTHNHYYTAPKPTENCSKLRLLLAKIMKALSTLNGPLKKILSDNKPKANNAKENKQTKFYKHRLTTEVVQD